MSTGSTMSTKSARFPPVRSCSLDLEDLVDLEDMVDSSNEKRPHPDEGTGRTRGSTLLP